MAPPAKVSNPPATLPGDFFDKQQGGPPDTLPADFFDKQDGAAPEKVRPSSFIQTLGGNAPWQKVIDEAAQTEPYQGNAGDIGRVAKNLGAGAVDLMMEPIAHPFRTAGNVVKALIPPSPFEPAPGSAKVPLGDSLAKITAMAPAAAMGVAAAPEIEAGLQKIPSASRAGATLQDIRNAAADVPVNFERTGPELQRFEELTQRGGKRSKPFTQLYKRANNTGVNVENGQALDPVKFPEARDFYTNVTDAAHQTPLQKIMGRGMKPTMRRQAVNVRRAMNDDLTDAAEQVGRGEDYANAMKEYANAMKLRKVMVRAGLLGAGEAARRTGLLGNWIHRTALTH